MPQYAQQQLAPESQVPQGLQLQYQPGIGDEQGGGGQAGGVGDAIGALSQYLKNRRGGASPADAESAWKAGGSL